MAFNPYLIPSADSITQLESLLPTEFPTVYVKTIGIYYYSSTSSLTANSYSVIQPNSVSGNGRYILQAQVVTPEQFGALGDGVTDDTTAINDAIAWLVAHDGGTIWLTSPLGYATTATVGAFDNPRNGVTILGYSSRIIYSGSGVAVQMKATGVSGNFQSPVFSVRGLGIFITGSGTYGLQHENAPGWYENVFVEGANTASFHFYNSLFWSENIGMQKCGSSVGVNGAYDIYFSKASGGSQTGSFSRFNCTEFLTQGSSAVIRVGANCTVYDGFIGPINGNISNAMPAYIYLETGADMADTRVGPINTEIDGAGSVGAFIIQVDGVSQVGPTITGWGRTSSTAGTKFWSDGTNSITPSVIQKINQLGGVYYRGFGAFGEDIPIAAPVIGQIFGRTTSAGDQQLTLWSAITSGTDATFASFGQGTSYTEEGTITLTSGVMKLNTSSDYRKKEITQRLSSTGGVFDNIPVYRGFIGGSKTEVPFFLAHEVAEGGIPEAVIGQKDAVDSDGNPIYQKLSLTDMVPYLWEEIRELRSRVKELENAVH